MPITDYKVVRAYGLDRFNAAVNVEIADGFVPYHDIVVLPSGDYLLAMVKGNAETLPIEIDDVTNAGTAGKALMAAEEVSDVATALGISAIGLEIMQAADDDAVKILLGLT